MKKGQALVEFVIILPIFLLIILGVIDMGRIFYEAGNNEDKIKKELDLDKDIKISQEKEEDYTNYMISKDIEIITPGLNLILSNPYKLIITRSIYNHG